MCQVSTIPKLMRKKLLDRNDKFVVCSTEVVGKGKRSIVYIDVVEESLLERFLD